MNIFNMLWKSATAYIIAGVALIQLASVVTDNISTVETLGITKETFMQILFVSIPLFLPVFLLPRPGRRLLRDPLFLYLQVNMF